jgi:protein TonB
VLVSTVAEVDKMFEQIVITEREKRNAPLSFAASLSVQTVAVGVVLALPLAHIARLEPKLPDIICFIPKRLGPVEQVRQVVSQAVTSSNSQVGRSYKVFQWPSKIPSHVAMGPDPAGAPVFPIGSPSVGDPNGVPDGIAVEFANQRLVQIAPPEPKRNAAVQPAEAVKRVRVGSGVQAAKLIFAPKPAYPPLAKQARISGNVHLSAVITTDGRIGRLTVVTGHALLIPAALEAVKQWTYQPTMLNGEPVEVLTEIDVNFLLNQ